MSQILVEVMTSVEVETTTEWETAKKRIESWDCSICLLKWR